ncbi:D-Ala-D-Ala carboxypeptidase family metallohydrolase [Photobacterium halotolerans]|uniref:D-Ala-D-Ala carboxypeptidase family metallohydrolase n=1 Tax=Photobacterium halotolerans TaxID=265726 RepID=UPI000400B45E|nr:D-Ala-D-Ala carboxypeptidase family metallohydrolase [Photobacterium halotolerans]
MGDLTKNISRHELACKCGACDHQTADFETVMIVQDACDHFAEKLEVGKVVLNIHSAHRCYRHNDAVGGAKKSQHRLGSALDISIRNVLPKDVYAYLDAKYPDRLGLGLYDTFVHVDTRKGKARW